MADVIRDEKGRLVPGSGGLPGAGRKPGSGGKKFQNLLKPFEDHNFNPIEEMIKIAKDKDTPRDLKFQACKELAQYLFPKKRSVEVSGAVTGEVQWVIDAGGDKIEGSASFESFAREEMQGVEKERLSREARELQAKIDALAAERSGDGSGELAEGEPTGEAAPQGEPIEPTGGAEPTEGEG